MYDVEKVIKARKRNGQLNITLSGKVTLTNLIVRSQMSTRSHEWVTCFGHMHKD